MATSSVPRPVYVYALIDPRTDEIRYVGQTVDLQARLYLHVAPGHQRANTYKNNWLKQLLALGLRPTMRVLEVADSLTWPEAERRWIRDLRTQGHNLTNLTDGGEGTPGGGWKLSPETRARIGNAQRGKVVTTETRLKLSRARKGRPTGRPPWNAGRPLPDAMKAKISATSKGHRKPPGHGEKVAASRRGKKRGPLPETTRDKIASSQRILALSTPRGRPPASGYRGVHLVKGRWRAMVRPHHKAIHLGTYDSAEEAAAVVQNALQRLHAGATTNTLDDAIAALKSDAAAWKQQQHSQHVQRQWSPEARTQTGERFRGRHQSTEQLDKISASRRHGRPGIRGVSLIKATGKWCARVWDNGHRAYLGSFTTQEEAAAVINAYHAAGGEANEH